MSGDTAVDGLVQILMGVASRYWQLVKIDGAGRRQVREISAAKAFFVDVFPAIASGGGNGIADNTDRYHVPDAEIQLQLLQLSRDAPADIALLLEREKGIDLTETLYYLNQMFQQSMIEHSQHQYCSVKENQ